MAIEPSGEMVYTTSSETARKRFISDYYGLKSPSELDAEDGSTPSDITPREMFDAKFKDYGLDKLTDEDGDPVTLTDEEALGIINIRYTMGFTAYQKYMTTTIASNVSRETMTDVLENSADLKGVAIEETTLRVYNDSVYFAPIIGYTGKVWDDELEKLKETNPDYELTDLVGKTGIEASWSRSSRGKRAPQTMYVNSTGRIVEIVEKTDPKAGNDVYLTIDRDLQIGIYNLLEQQLGRYHHQQAGEPGPGGDRLQKGLQYPHSGEGCVLPADQQQCAGHGRVFCPGGVPGGKIHLRQVQPVQGADPFLDPVGAVERECGSHGLPG